MVADSARPYIGQREGQLAAIALLSSYGVAVQPGAGIFYVNAAHAHTGTGKSGLDPNNPLNTIDEAYNNCIASRGDVVVVSPFHTENIANATDLVLDTIGVTVVGIGEGDARPKLTFTAAGGNIPMSAVGNTFKNFILTTTGTINVTIGITATGNGCILDDIEFLESSATSQFIIGVHASTMVGGLIKGMKFLGLAGDATIAAIRMSGSDRLEITGCRLVGNFQGSADATGAIQSLTTLNVDIDIHHNRIENRDGTSEAGIVFVATDTGFVYENFIAVPTGDFLQGIVAGNVMRQYNNFVVDVAQERGAPIGTASA